MSYPATVDTGQVQPYALYLDDLQQGGLSSGFAAGAIFINGIIVSAPLTILAMECRMGTATGNIDMGIYDVNFNLLVHKGATAAASGLNTLTFASPLPLSPGQYWLAWMDTIGTDTVYEANSGLGGFQLTQRSVATTFTQIAANASWQTTSARIGLLAKVQGGYP